MTKGTEIENVGSLSVNVEQRALVKVNPLSDLEIQTLITEAEKILAYARTRQVTNPQEAKCATDDLSAISGIKKRMEASRKGYLDPINAIKDELNQVFKDIMAPVFEADRITRDKMLAFNREQQRIQVEQEEINRKRMEAAEAEMQLKGELTESVNLVEVVEAPKHINTAMGAAGMTKIWKFEVIDFSLLPDRFKMENATLIGKVVRAGEREIPGVKIWAEDSLRVTTR